MTVERTKKRVNPFYVLLVLVGVAFVVTASAYFVMCLKQLHTTSLYAMNDAADQAFVRVMDQYGVKVMLIELAVLGVATFGAIGTDRFWEKPS